MFASFRLNLRNVITLAKPLMKLTEENYRGMLAVVDLLSEKRWALIGIGEDVKTVSPEVIRLQDRLMVPADAQQPGEVVFYKASFPFDLLLRDVIIDGENVDWGITKHYPDNQTFVFNSSQLPIKSNNFELKVIIQPGGYVKRTALLLEIIM